MDIPIISVTGTKGKTTTVAVIADVLRRLDRNVLKVDTTGHFVNGERRSTLEDSKNTWRLVPSVCPGRYLWEFHVHPALRDNAAAVLECSLGSSATPGLGYRSHKVGVFLNVFEDHIGSSSRIQSKADIATAKQFIFHRLHIENSYAVFNADDAYVTGKLQVVPHQLAPTDALIPCGITFSEFPLEDHLKNGGSAVTIDDQKRVVIRTQERDTIVADLKRIPWTFDATFMPSVWNILCAVAAVYAMYDKNLPSGVSEAFESVRLDPYGGRLTILRSSSGVRILADYAHEKVSLATVADLAKTMVQPGGRVIGVVRLAHDRTDELMRETGRVVGASYDSVVVYEKIDGHWRKPKRMPEGSRFPQIVGRTSEIFAGGASETNTNVRRILREDEALKYAASIARPEDVVVVIVNDDIRQSIQFIKRSFKAEFV
ncbi:MAG: Mur ligase family protein [Candidatus Saccharimonadales bacterium]